MTDPAVAVVADTDNVVDKSDEITWCLKFHCHLCYARVLLPEVATLLIFSLELASVADRQGPLRPARSSSGGPGTTLHSRSGGRYTDTDGLNIQIPAAPPAQPNHATRWSKLTLRPAGLQVAWHTWRPAVPA